MKVLSLGAGVQSSALLLMSAIGEIEKVDCAIFADTRWESAATYQQVGELAAFAGVRGIPVLTVEKGDLRYDTLNRINGSNPPFVVLKPNQEIGRLGRNCTRDYKLQPIQKKLREMRADKEQCELWLGISIDESHRMKDSRIKWINHRWPLIERQMDRNACAEWLKAHDFKVPERSACLGCPYKSNYEWRQLKAKPEEWRQTVEFDESIRHAMATVGPVFVHRSAQPLVQIDLRSATELGQQDLFGEECEGLCGV